MNAKNPHHLPDGISPDHILESTVGKIYFCDNIVIVEAKEGITLSYKNGFPVLVFGLQYLGTKPFVYISNRIHSYSVNPNDYKYLEKVPTLMGLAIVTPTELGNKNAEMELNFFDKPMTIFSNIDEAFGWAEDLLTQSAVN